MVSYHIFSLAQYMKYAALALNFITNLNTYMIALIHDLFQNKIHVP